MDEAVLATQVWVNSMYGGRKGYEPAPENGKTGWSTMYSLTRALQLELGITNTADSFGPTTIREYNKFGILEEGKVPDTEQGRNIVKILQGAMYCKGYNPEGITGIFGETMKNSIIKLQADAGLPIRDGRVYDYVFKAFLTMDAYVLTFGGDPKIREIQQELNNKYYTTSGVQPCDGHYQRGTNKALVYGLQTEMNIPAGDQTGSVGPATKAGLPILREGNSGQFVKLFQYALYFNRFDSSPFNGMYDSKVKSQVTQFQAFTLLNPDGVGNLQTWLSLLLSTGDPDRKGKACDCVTEITPARAQTLVSEGYKTVGRYLTNASSTSLNKKIQPGELNTIFNAELSIFPIFQTYGDKSSYFNYQQGTEDASSAYNAAKQYGFKNDTTIYFAVDFDAYGVDITDNIIPYFRGINTQFIKLGSPYRIGVYGARNVCIQVSELGLASKSFVSGMSTGFSGNLGFPLPSNWAFDQISTKKYGSGTGQIEVDNNIMSSKDMGQTSVGSPTPINKEALEELKIIYDLAMEYTGNVIPRANFFVANFYRKNDYNSDLWYALLGDIDQQFVDYVEKNYKVVTKFKNLVDPQTRKTIGIEHLMATLGSVVYNSNLPVVGEHISDFAGWIGDLLTLMKDVHRERKDDSFESTYEAAFQTLGLDPEFTYFSYDDYLADIDAVNIGMELYYNLALNIYDAFAQYYEGERIMTRFSDFYKTKFKSSKEKALETAEIYLNSNSPLHADIIAARRKFNEAFKVPDYTVEDGVAVATAWADRISSDAIKEQ